MANVLLVLVNGEVVGIDFQEGETHVSEMLWRFMTGEASAHEARCGRPLPVVP